MTTTSPARNLAEMSARLTALEAKVAAGIDAQIWVDETSGDTSTTEFTISQKGWKPKLIFVGGDKMREGSGEDYTMVPNGFSWVVTFAVAPAAVDVSFVCVRAAT